jgi:hypothetical protein
MWWFVHAKCLRPKIDHISANSEQNSKRNQGLRGYCLKNEGHKSRGTVPIKI